MAPYTLCHCAMNTDARFVQALSLGVAAQNGHYFGASLRQVMLTYCLKQRIRFLPGVVAVADFSVEEQDKNILVAGVPKYLTERAGIVLTHVDVSDISDVVWDGCSSKTNP